MSFSVSCDGCGLEYSGRRPFAQPRNAASPRFLALLCEIGRWLRTARRVARRGRRERQSLGDYLDERGYSRRFRRHFLVPLTSALWSTAPGRALEFPAALRDPLLRQPRHARLRPLPLAHGHRRQPQLRARSRRGSAAGCGSGAAVRALRRDAGRRRGAHRRRRASRRFDAVVVATHADQALALLEDPSDRRARACSAAFAYTRNEAVLHTDASLLPAARGGARVLELPAGDDAGRPT